MSNTSQNKQAKPPKKSLATIIKSIKFPFFALAVAVAAYFLTPSAESPHYEEDSAVVTEIADSSALSATAANTEIESVISDKIYKLPNGLTLLPIPTGSFKMGSDDEQRSGRPAHKVFIKQPFWMSKTEITFDQYDAYAKATGQRLPDDKTWGRGTRPVIDVSWDDSQAYVKWLTANNDQGLSCRLPSEAEWEYAARAGSSTSYYWGDDIGKNNANCDDCGSEWGAKSTAPVGSFAANQWGLNDMLGNVWEWVEDPKHEGYKGAPNMGEVWKKGGDTSHRVLRGGSWDLTEENLRSAYRFYLPPDFRYFSVGFRVVCTSK